MILKKLNFSFSFHLFILFFILTNTLLVESQNNSILKEKRDVLLYKEIYIVHRLEWKHPELSSTSVTKDLNLVADPTESSCIDENKSRG